jgi:small-conductance mechanosensitive channel
MVLVKSKIDVLVLIILVLFIPANIHATQEATSDTQPTEQKQEIKIKVPSIADLTPLIAEMSSRKAVLEKQMPDTAALSAVESRFSEIQNNIKQSALHLQQLKATKEFRYRQYVVIKTEVGAERNFLENGIKPITDDIRQLEIARNEWLKEKKKWSQWKAMLLAEEPVLEEVKLILEVAHDTIDEALDLITLRLRPMLSVQKQAGKLQIRIDTLTAEIDNCIKVWESTKLVEKTPPMYSPDYAAQLKNDLQSRFVKGLVEVEWPSVRFFERQGWVVSFQLLASLVLIILILRNRMRLRESKRLQYLAKRPVSAGVFFGFITTSVFYRWMPQVWQLVQLSIICFSFARLIGIVIKKSWKRRFVYALLILIISFQLLEVLFLPISFLRLYTLFTALTILIVCGWWAAKKGLGKDSLFLTLGFYSGSLLLVVVAISEIWGQTEMADYMYVPVIKCGLILVIGWLMIYLASGILEMLLKGTTIQRIKFVQGNADTLLQQLSFLTNVFIGIFILSLSLVTLRIYETPIEAINGMLSLGITLGEQQITVGLLIFALAIIVGGYFISWLVQKAVIGEILGRRHVSRGVQLSISRLFHYAIVSVGFLFAIFTLGFELTQFVIIISALGVGIGFGLQSFVNNFICGLILLFERPVRVGDYVDLNGQWAIIKRIGLRSTTVETFDLANIIIPNNDLINNQVTNWTLSDRFVRVIIPVGVAYGSDVNKVFETLLKCGKSHPNVAKDPEPQVLFRQFGDSALNFELRIWTSDIDNRLALVSDIHRDIDQKFRDAGIVIAFPQRDVHLDGTKPVEVRVLTEEEK